MYLGENTGDEHKEMWPLHRKVIFICLNFCENDFES